MSLAFTISHFAERYEVIRPGCGTWQDGHYRNLPEDRFCIIASIQPSTPRTMDRESEGQRARALIRVWTKTELRVADVKVKRKADRVVYNDEEYEVETVADWNGHGDFYRITAVKEGQ